MGIRDLQELFSVIWGCKDGIPTWNTYQYEVCAPLQLVGWNGVGILVGVDGKGWEY